MFYRVTLVPLLVGDVHVAFPVKRVCHTLLYSIVIVEVLSFFVNLINPNISCLEHCTLGNSCKI